MQLRVQEQLEEPPFFVFSQLFAEKTPSRLPSTDIFGENTRDLVSTPSLSRPLIDDIDFFALLLWGVPRDTFKCQIIGDISTLGQMEAFTYLYAYSRNLCRHKGPADDCLVGNPVASSVVGENCVD